MISRTSLRAKSAHSVATETKRPPFPKETQNMQTPWGAGQGLACKTNMGLASVRSAGQIPSLFIDCIDCKFGQVIELF